MEIWNHFTFRKDMHPLTTQYILEKGIRYEYGEIISAVDISENDPHWKELVKLIEREKNSYISETKFSKSELLSAEWLQVRSKWYYDYPQPENEYTNITYTNENLCSNRDCGIELVQKDAFRFKRTPKWGKRNFCMTNWVYDELFVSTRAKEMLEKSTLNGFSFVEVKNKSGKEVLNDIYQLKILNTLSSGIADPTSGINKIFICPKCGNQKVRHNGRGQFVFHREVFDGSPDFVKSAEWFGGGAGASKLILISQEGYRFITENLLDSSLVFEPIMLV